MVVMTNLFQYAIIHINKTAACFYAPLLKGWIVAFIPSPWHMVWEGKGERWRLGGVGRVGGVGGMGGVGEVTLFHMYSSNHLPIRYPIDGFHLYNGSL